jgi:hypothetical protein
MESQAVFHVHRSPEFVHILSQKSPFHTFTNCLFKKNLIKIITSFVSGSPFCFKVYRLKFYVQSYLLMHAIRTAEFLTFFDLVLIYYKVSHDVTILPSNYFVSPLNARFQRPDLIYHQLSSNPPPPPSSNISYLVALSRFFFEYWSWVPVDITPSML